MTNTIIYCIRHGEIDNPQKVQYGRTIDVHLNGEGKEQIEEIARLIQSESAIDVVYASPLSRSVESATIFATFFPNMQIIIEPLLSEIDIPATVGHPVAEVDRLHEKGLDVYIDEYIKKGNESREEVTDRMYKALSKIRSKYAGKTIALFSHGDPLTFLYYRLTSPNRSIPTMGILRKIYYPAKGEGFSVELNNKGKVYKIGLIKRKGRVKI